LAERPEISRSGVTRRFYPRNDSDGDEDGVIDSQDSDPRNNALKSDWNHDGDDNESDWDEDGHDNGSDSHPADPSLWADYDGDGHNAEDDSHPDDGSLWSDWNGNGTNHATDGDEDGFADLSDSDPRNPALWIDWNRDGYNDGSEPADRDGDGLFDNADNYPDDPYNNADSDNDGLIDRDEVFTHGTDRYNVDTDGDGLTDYEELLVYHTNPLAQKTNAALPYTDYDAVDQTDSDNDQIPDRVEQWYANSGFGMNAHDPGDANGDLDGDGVSNWQAYQYGWSLVLYLDTFDADEDRISDAVEDHWAAVAPESLNKNVFADAVADFDNDGVMNFEEITLRLNLAAPSSGRADNLSDVQVLAQSETLTTRVLPADCDGDGMSDVWEYRYFLRLRDASDAGAASGLLEALPALMSWEEFVIVWDPSGVNTPTEQNYLEYTEQHAQTAAARAQTDPDFDTLSNLREFQLGSHPRIADTDGDGWDDASELLAGSNATLFGSTPLNPTGGTNTGGGGTTGTSGSGGTNTNPTAPTTPPVITLAGRYNAVGFSVTQPQRDEEYGTADETDRKAALEGEGYIDVTAGSDASSHLVRTDEDGTPVYADWKLERGRPGNYSYAASGTDRTEPEAILTDEEITDMIAEGGEEPEIEVYLAFDPPEPDKSKNTDAKGLEASRGSHSEGLATFQTGSWKEFWLKASAAVPEAVSRTYVLHKTSGGNSTPQITVITLTIPKGGTHSTTGTNSTASDTNGRNGTIKLHPAEGETMSLLPIEVSVPATLDVKSWAKIKDAPPYPTPPEVTYKPATEVNIATWENSFTTNKMDVAHWWVKNDVDHIRVRIPRPDLAGTGALKVKIRTENPSALSEYDDPENDFELKESTAEPGVFENVLMLVSDDGDDRWDGRDETLQDYTHKIAVGGELVIKYEGSEISRLKVKEKGRMRLRPLVMWYKGALSWYPAVTTSAVKKDVENIQQRFAQAGIAVDWDGGDWGIDAKQVPGVSDYFKNGSMLTKQGEGVTNDEIALNSYIASTYADTGKIGPKDIVLVYCEYLREGGAEATQAAYTLTPTFAASKGIRPMVITTAQRHLYTMAHETLHVVLDDVHSPATTGHHNIEHEKRTHLWSGGPDNIDETGRKRMSKTTKDFVVPDVQNSKFVKP
jgi:hypothetical protein